MSLYINNKALDDIRRVGWHIIGSAPDGTATGYRGVNRMIVAFSSSTQYALVPPRTMP